MKHLGITGVAALALACTVTMLDARTASAGTFFDFLRSNKYAQSPRQRDASLPGVDTAIAMPAPAATPKPLPKVSSPQYYTYKPESLRLVAASSFADPVVTGAVDASGTIGSADTSSSEQRRFLSEAKVRANNDVAAALEAYYGKAGPMLWISPDGLNEKAQAAMAVLADAGNVGLDPRDYAVAAPVAPIDANDTAARDRGLTQFELALSAKVLAYVQDTVRGRIDPNGVSGYHDFKHKVVDLKPVLKLVSMSHDVGAYIHSRDPSGQEFELLKAELVRLKAEQTGGETINIQLSGLLKPGETSTELPNIVEAIKKHGSDALKVEHSVTLAGYQQTLDYTPEIVALVESFQKQVGLKADGVIGPASVRAMVGDSSSSKVDKLVVALEQARWLPNDLGSRYVFINQPAFMVYYHNNNKEELSMRVVVGAPGHQTFFFQDEIETVEVNPFWGVPQSIIINEMLPKLRSDPSYLDRMGYEVAVNGQAVASSSVDWNGSTNAISVRQPPSGDNALGELKILFPNAHAIYMHDTPSKSFFKRDMRALSHGCVRLADPRAMAAAVLNTTVDEVGKQIAGGKNKALPVNPHVPVYVAYFTAWPNKDGVIQYFDDVYSRDAAVNKAFAATTRVRDAQS